jgi:hypothetical protein
LKRWEQVVAVLQSKGGEASLHEIYRGVEALTGEALTAGQEASLRKAIETRSSDSDNFRGGPDTFRSSRGRGFGFWALR